MGGDDKSFSKGQFREYWSGCSDMAGGDSVSQRIKMFNRGPIFLLGVKGIMIQ